MVELLRMSAVLQRYGLARPTLYRDIRRGVFPRPVKMGRASAWPRVELEAVIAARIAGKTDDEVCELVADLERQRLNAAA
ncbi:AlpA family phage regulatory protein [Sphingomonas psychrotolerans]|uniref:AlpA family phage regulatory protein n=1 Tax=Sphingomonas psychrotolerans TaxID=1327635 RepID=A0ABU3N4M4_9SPHN|nr:AlpA family phage regulatory protein [Sphingomonas psychrotolerans]MDT8759216.1 AlpA family phage regulatory protein [Sphingomonas psychrotolerans]